MKGVAKPNQYCNLKNQWSSRIKIILMVDATRVANETRHS